MNKSKLLSLCLVVVLVLTSALTLVSCFKGNEYLTKVDLVVYMQQNGDIVVRERWDVKVGSDSIRNLYRNIDLYDSNTKITSKLKDFSVKDNISGVELIEATSIKDPEDNPNSALDCHYYAYPRGGSRYELGCYFEESSNTNLSYTFSYTITDMVAVYADTAVLYYQPYSDEFSLYADEISIKVVLPNGAEASSDTYAWLHTENINSSYQVKADAIYFTSTQVDTGNYTEIRVLAPVSLFKDTKKEFTAQKRDAIIAEEKAWFDAYQATLKRNQTISVIGLVAGCLLVVVGILMAVYFKLFFPKVKGEYPPYLREIPEGTTSAEMAHFYYHYKGTLSKQKNRGNVLSATIMDLARRGYITLSPIPQNPDDFCIELNSIPDQKYHELEHHEQLFYDLIKEIRSAFNSPISMADFEAYARDHAIEVNNTIDAFIRNSGSAYREADNFKLRSFKQQNLLGFGIICIVFGAMIFMISELINYFGLGLAVFGIILTAFAPRVNKFSLKGEQEYMKAKGLEAFMLDFSNLKEHEIPALILWEEYMVFATMMGISERVLAELKLKYPKLWDEPTLYGYNNRSYLYFYVHMNMHHHGSFDLGSALNRSFTNISTTTHHIVQASKAQSMSSKMGGFGHGGGGFSGGGGGFGGGGGGAR